MPHMKCVCFLRTTEDSLAALEAELSEPKYGEYYLCQSVNYSTMKPHLNTSDGFPPDFSNILSKTAIERLAEVDEYEVVKEVQVSPFHPAGGRHLIPMVQGILCRLCRFVAGPVLFKPQTDILETTLRIDSEYLGCKGP